MASILGKGIRWAARATDRSLRVPPILEIDEATGKAGKDSVGRVGEKLAARYLWLHGMKILYRNYRAQKGGEVDIVARDGKVLVFAEVKARTSRDFGRPADAVTRDKQRLIARGAMSWMRLLDAPVLQFRFDVVELVLEPDKAPEINHIREAFSLPENLSVF